MRAFWYFRARSGASFNMYDWDFCFLFFKYGAAIFYFQAICDYACL